ncbi:hypothetical protein IJ750_07425 [bacterium]|nr:hypothetical protein [bacterium]
MSINFGIGGYSARIPSQISEQGPQIKNGKVFQEFKEKYGCEDCFRRHPYWVEAPMPVMQLPPEVINPTLFDRIKRRYMGG